MWVCMSNSYTLHPFYSFFRANEDPKWYLFRQNPEVVEYQHQEGEWEARNYATRFYQTDGDNSGEVEEKTDLLYIADFQAGSTTGIKPTIRTIDTDGTRRYFDLQGRQLNVLPGKGVYIENGKKYIAK